MARTTYAELRTWRRADGCWVAAAGPYTARARQERPLGEPARGRRHDPDRHLPDRPHDVRQRGEPRRPLPLPAPPLRRLVGRGSRPRRPTTPSSTSPAATTPPFAGDSEGMWQQPRPYPYPRGGRVQHAPGRAGQGLRDLPPRADRRADDRLRLAAEGRAARRPALAAPGRRAGDRDRHAARSSAADQWPVPAVRNALGSGLFLVVAPGRRRRPRSRGGSRAGRRGRPGRRCRCSGRS